MNTLKQLKTDGKKIVYLHSGKEIKLDRDNYFKRVKGIIKPHKKDSSFELGGTLKFYFDSISGAVRLGANELTELGRHSLGIGNKVIAKGISSIAFGENIEAREDYSQATGKDSIAKYVSSRTYSSGMLKERGDSQIHEIHLSGVSLSSGGAELTIGGNAPGRRASIVLDNASYILTGTVIGRDNQTGDTHAFEISAVAKGENAELIGKPIIKTLASDKGAFFWKVDIVADKFLKVKVFGEGKKRIHWGADIKLNEIK